MVCYLCKYLGELLDILGVEEDTLAFLLAGRSVGRNFRNRDIMLTFGVSVRVDVIDASSCADTLGDCWLIHFDDVFDDVVERGGVEPPCRLFSGHYYLPTPGQPWGALTECQSLM